MQLILIVIVYAGSISLAKELSFKSQGLKGWKKSEDLGILQQR